MNGPMDGRNSERSVKGGVGALQVHFTASGGRSDDRGKKREMH